MKNFNLLIFALLFSGVAMCLTSACGNTTDGEKSSTADGEISENLAQDTLPFTLEFREKTYSNPTPLPRLQSYSYAMSDDGELLVMGGRRQGLHTFMPAPEDNFIPDSSNNFIFVFDLEEGSQWSFDVNQLKPELSAPLQANNQQFHFDRDSSMLYIVGGYGWKADQSDMKTFGTLIKVNAEKLIQAVKSGASTSEVESLFEWMEDDRLAVTGGDLSVLNNTFYLVMGQRFDGQYRAFGGTDFSQKYTEEIRVFTLNPNKLEILSYGSTTNTEFDSPFHRRDLNILDDVDPVTGSERISVFGGVFPPGIIGAYTYPIFIHGPQTPVLDRDINQKFSQYECPVISIYDDKSEEAAVFHTFFGGISHYYFSQTDSQKVIYDLATKQGRNDGLPFIADITTLQINAVSEYSEYIHPDPIPDNRLLGTGTHFILNPKLIANGQAMSNGVLTLSSFEEGSQTTIGYIYGGIEAKDPLPKIPNTGTWVTNSVFEVILHSNPREVIPASQGHESTVDISNLPYLEAD